MNTENTTINSNGVQVSVRKDSAATYYIRHPNASYGIFCFNEAGDLFLNSDWGMYGFAWRSYGKDFREFLAQTNADYIFQKFDTNTRYLHSKGLPKHVQKPVTALIEAFIQALKEELKPVES